jgi:rhodanese-related sulfurtransferase
MVLAIAIVATLLFITMRKKILISNPNVKNITSEEANRLIKETKNLLILDVRSKGEFDGGHIPGAKCIPANELTSRISEIEKFKNLPVLVYCASGGRSPSAVSSLVKNNYTQIYHMSRGISSWAYDIKR